MPPEGLGHDEHDDLLAAEYVLGTLPADERRAALERAQVDGAFAARIRSWELHFEPLNDAYDDAPAPDLLPQIEAQLFGQPAKPSRPSRFGLGWFSGGPAAEDVELRFAARWDAAAGQLEVTRASGAAAPTGQDYELWLIDESGVPTGPVLAAGALTET